MSFEHAITFQNSGVAPASIFSSGGGDLPLASFLRTGFDGDVIVIYMRPERVFGFQKAKLELIFEIAEPDAGVAAAAGTAGCAERKFDGLVSATGELSFQHLAVLAEFLGKALAQQNRKSGIEIEIQVLSPSGDLEAAKVQLDALVKEIFVQ